MTMPLRKRGEIIPGAGTIIDNWLGLNEDSPGTDPHYHHEETFQCLYSNPWPDFSGVELANELHGRLGQDWRLMRAGIKPRLPGKQNWRFDKRIKLDAQHTGPEVTLERTIIRITDDNWTNQCPTSSGLLDGGGRVCNIDLIHRLGSAYEFIELKVADKTPLFAAMEMLQYGVVYAFSRLHAKPLQYSTRSLQLMDATAVHLRVLAPLSYYPPASRKWLQKLEASLSNGLCQFSKEMEQLDCNLDFAFESFPLDFVWNQARREEKQHRKDLLWALHTRERLF